MGARAVSPGGALLRTSRIFSLPKPLPQPTASKLHGGDLASTTMTRQHPQHQTLSSPLSSREKGDWGLKRPFPLKTTMTTSTPLIRIKKLDTVENVTDFASAADHTISLDKFQEMNIAMSAPQESKRNRAGGRSDLWPKSVFEEDVDTTTEPGQGEDSRWKFQGPWLARMTEGDFTQYLDKKVRPKRAQFRALLRKKLAEDITERQNTLAQENGRSTPAKVEAKDITDLQFTDFLRSLRNDRVTLYALVSKYLDLPPLGRPVGIVQSISTYGNLAADSRYGKAGPPPSHPSAGISYLRTNSVLENHPVYGPQAKRTPVAARVLYPRSGPASAKFGVGGFVADAPSGDNEFNSRHGRGRQSGSKTLLNGIMHLDVDTFGGAKAYVEVSNATVDPSGKVVLQLKETSPEAQVVARETKGLTEIYHTGQTERYIPPILDPASDSNESKVGRMNRVITEMLEEEIEQQSGSAAQDTMSSSEAYGLGTVNQNKD